MDSLLLIALLGVGLLVILLSSFIAKILKVKRYQPYWMVLPWLLALMAVIAANIYQLDGLYALAAGMVVFILSLEILIGMGFTRAVTITIASFAILTIASAGALYGLKQSGAESRPMTNFALELIPQSKYYSFAFVKETGMDGKNADLLVEELTPDYSDYDLLPNRVIHRPVLESRTYREISPKNAGSMKGATMRLLKTDGTLLKGSIVEVKGNRLIVSKYIPNKGVIKAPIPIASIKKLEVMGKW